ncbi:MAG: hypothetical protein HOL98_10650 [Gammaproteobacteria bacterium]|nr:hypothetical protein [Gammaproteobacteria bacterium]MBT5603678.1 hypothetical protein [Gammaproteobacteria bacterium]MBT6245358.1 hypothetical protein [Gammaproteobacteria bacterium]
MLYNKTSVKWTLVIGLFVGSYGIDVLLLIGALRIDPESTLSFLLFLPHGIRIFATYFLGFWACLPLFLAHLISYQLFPSADDTLLACLIGASCAPLAFEFFKQAKLNLYYSSSIADINSKALVLVGTIASLFNIIGTRLIISADAPESFFSATFFLSYLVGDIIGLILCIVIFNLLFNRLRAYL